MSKNITNTATFSTDKVFYFTVDYKATKRAIKEHIDAKNAELKALWENDPDEFRRQHGKLATYRKLSFKSGEETTVWAVLDLFAGFLKRNATNGLIDMEFRSNNEAVKHLRHDRIHRTTVYRHIDKAGRIGIFCDKVFLGSNTSYILQWNTGLIRYNQNLDYNKYLVAEYKAQFCNNSPLVPPAAFRRLYALKPTSGTISGLGFTVASCNHIHSILKLEHKINIESGIVDIENFASSGQNVQINNEKIELSLNNGRQQPGMNTPPVAAAPPRPENAWSKLEKHADQAGQSIERAQSLKGKSAATPEDQIWNYVIRTYAFLISSLYPDRHVSDMEKNLTCLLLYRQYKRAMEKSQAKTAAYPLNFHYADFLKRILLTKKYLTKNPFFKIASPLSYLDLDAEFGFNKTAEWLEKTNRMEQANKEYLSHYKLLIKLYADYTRDPSVQTYTSINQRLGKLKNKSFQELFNSSVANLKTLSQKDLHGIWKTNYQVSN